MPKPIKKDTAVVASFENRYAMHMAKLGSVNDTVNGGDDRTDMPAKQLRDAALRAARARWATKAR